MRYYEWTTVYFLTISSYLLMSQSICCPVSSKKPVQYIPGDCCVSWVDKTTPGDRVFYPLKVPTRFRTASLQCYNKKYDLHELLNKHQVKSGGLLLYIGQHGLWSSSDCWWLAVTIEQEISWWWLEGYLTAMNVNSWININKSIQEETIPNCAEIKEPIPLWDVRVQYK